MADFTESPSGAPPGAERPVPARPVPVPPVPERDAGRRPLSALAREPLLHFLLIGALLFGLGHVLGTGRDANRTITVTPEWRQRITDDFAAARGRPPTDAEYARAVRNWVATEILYREAAALRLDGGDEMIRDRLVQKMRLLVDSRVMIPKPSETELRTWFETRRAEFDTPMRIDFFEVPVDGPDAEARAGAFVAGIEAGNDPPEIRNRARIFANRTPAALGQVFGGDFVEALLALPVRAWRPLRSGVGWHLVRVDAVHPGKPADFDELRANLEVVYLDARRREAVAKAIADLGAGYDVRRADGPREGEGKP